MNPACRGGPELGQYARRIGPLLVLPGGGRRPGAGSRWRHSTPRAVGAPHPRHGDVMVQDVGWIWASVGCAALLAGCGRIGFDAGSGDGSALPVDPTALVRAHSVAETVLQADHHRPRREHARAPPRPPSSGRTSRRRARRRRSRPPRPRSRASGAPCAARGRARTPSARPQSSPITRARPISVTSAPPTASMPPTQQPTAPAPNTANVVVTSSRYRTFAHTGARARGAPRAAAGVIHSKTLRPRRTQRVAK